MNDRERESEEFILKKYLSFIIKKKKKFNK